MEWVQKVLIGAAALGAIALAGTVGPSPAARGPGASLQRLDTLAEAMIRCGKARDAGHAFLGARTTTTLDRHEAEAGAIHAALTQLRRAGLDVPVESALTALAIYRTTFARLVAELQLRGFDENSGLEGSARRAAHFVESMVQTLAEPLARTELTAAYLTIRRHEKDLLLRGRPDYLARAHAATAAFVALAERHTIGENRVELARSTWRLYDRALEELAASLERIERARTDWQHAGTELTQRLHELGEATRR